MTPPSVLWIWTLSKPTRDQEEPIPTQPLDGALPGAMRRVLSRSGGLRVPPRPASCPAMVTRSELLTAEMFSRTDSGAVGSVPDARTPGDATAEG